MPRFGLSMLHGLGVVLLALATAPALAQVEWRSTAGPEGGSVEALAVHGDTAYAAAHNNLFRSVDGGHSWKHVWQASAGIEALAVGAGRLYAITIGDGVFTSEDGLAWISLGLGGVQGVDLLYEDTLVAGTGGGLFRYDGTGWTSIHPATAAGDSLVTAVAAGPGQGLAFGTGDGAVYVSSEDGAWEFVGRGGGGTVGPAVLSLVATADGNLVAGTLDGLYRYVRVGAEWSLDASFVRNLNAEVLCRVPNGSLLASFFRGGLYQSLNDGATWDLLAGTASDGGLYRSDDGAVWQLSNTGLVATRTYAFSAAGKAIYAATRYDGLHRSLDAGSTWEPRGLGGLWLSAVAAYPEGIVLAGATPSFNLPGGLFRSTDGGGSWAPIAGVENDLPVYALAQDAVDAATLYAGAGSLYRSHDRGATWASVLDETVFATAARGDVVYVGTPERLLRSLDYGATWEETGLTFGLFDYPTAIDILPDGSVYASALSGVYHSATGTAPWANTGLNSVRALHRAPDGVLYASTSIQGLSGVYQYEGGTEWRLLGLNDLSAILDLEVTPDGRLLAGVYGRGAWRASESTVAVEPLPAPDVVWLALYPNPTAGAAVLRYHLGSAQHVRVEVLDVLGRRIAILADAVHLAGIHTARIGARSFAPGVYFVRLVTEASTQVQRLTVVR